jgi:hypothetical protein
MGTALRVLTLGSLTLALAIPALAQSPQFAMPVITTCSSEPPTLPIVPTDVHIVDRSVATLPVGTPAASELCVPQPAECLGEMNGGDRPWVMIAPYAWIFGMHGTVGAGRRVQQVDFSVQDALDHLSDLQGALQLHIEAGYGDYGAITDLTYLDVVPLDRVVRVESRSAFFELLGLYRLVNPGCRYPGAVTLDLLAGGRYYWFTNSIRLNGVDAFPVERTEQWLDLVIGARVGVQLTESLGVFLHGDIGGFGIGQSSSQACNIVTGFEYQCSQCCSVLAGYRWLSIERSDGFGRDAFLLDVTMSGPFIAVALRF